MSGKQDLINILLINTTISIEICDQNFLNKMMKSHTASCEVGGWWLMEVVGKLVKRRGRSVLALTQFSKTDRQTAASIKGASQDIWPCQKGFYSS